MTFWQRLPHSEGKNETRLVGEERGSQSVGKMNLEKVRKPVENGGVDWDKGCNKSALWQGGTSLVNSSGGGVGWGIMGWWQKAQRRGQQWKLGLFLVLPRQEQ